MKAAIRNQGPAVICAALLFAQSSVPSDKIPPLDIFTFDKLIHTVIYFVFAFALAHALRHQRRWVYGSEHWFVCGALIATLYALSDETHQMFVRGRSASVADLNADVLGVGLALLTFARFPSRPKESDRPH